MQHARTGAPNRGLVLGTAFTIGLALALANHIASVRATDLARIVAAADAKAAAAQSTPDGAVTTPNAAPAPPATPASPKAEPPKSDAAEADESDTDAADVDISKSKSGDKIIIRKGDKRVRIEGFGGDREYDSFQQFVHDAPWLAGLVFLSVLLVFLVPLLVIVLLIWYKLRKNRLANETMLKLAERGVVPPAAAMDAVATGTAASVAAAAVPAASPAYEHARFLHRRTVWSDLRRGVIVGAVGLGLTFFSMLDDGTPNSVGLILLFVGIGYCALWFFEGRTGVPPSNPPGTPPPPGSA